MGSCGAIRRIRACWPRLPDGRVSQFSNGSPGGRVVIDTAKVIRADSRSASRPNETVPYFTSPVFGNAASQPNQNAR